MNERIKELSLRARDFALEQKRIYDNTHTAEQCMEDYRDAYNEKFAELIVRECISVRTELTQFDGTTEYGDGYENGLKDMAEVIAEVFGVE
jgi:hypothetical protein